MLSSDRLPDFVFIAEDGGETTLQLRHMAGRIRAIGAHLGARLPRGAVIGLMFPSGPELVLAWLGSLQAGLRPLVMQYPTRKQSRTYWADSVRNTIATTGLAAVVADAHSCGLGLANITIAIPAADLAALPDCDGAPFVIDDFAIVQLSSGTTGHRKAVEFTAAALRRHVEDYNAVIGLTATDRIVSWLPLYHDMGYVACFVMPLLLGVEVVMMDPMTWVRRPGLLFEAIARHRGTICYQPNFGYEVMSRTTAQALPTMRWWISCSEPVSAETSRRFLAHIGAPEATFAPCYAMAENIFALSLCRGIRTRTIDDVEVVSCGAAIPGVALKIVGGEIWAHSPTSLAAYIGGDDIRDADGFYPTGDLGDINGDDLYVTGRKQDLLIQAGRKFMLSDIDLTLNRLYPDIRGRAAALAIYDARLGTQLPLVLIEAQDFFRRKDQPEIAEALESAMGLDQIEVAFVPPRFLTKTSSGKINRKTSATNWRLHLTATAAGSGAREDPVVELRASFPGADWQGAVEKTLDSLSLTILRVILGETRLAYDGTMSLAAMAAKIEALRAAPAPEAPTEEVIRIVSLADTTVVASLTPAHLDRLGAMLGAKVVFEHVCLPPSAILLSDIIFHDWYQPRFDQADFAAIDRAFAKLRDASMILTDDVTEMLFPPNQVYGVLSHNLERDPRADLVAVRWQRYAQYHHRLPLTVVAGADVPLDECTRALEMLGDYLGVPLFRVAVVAGFGVFTEGWEYRPMHGGAEPGAPVRGVVEPDELVRRIAEWASAREGGLARRRAVAGPPMETSDLPHFCSHYIIAGAVETVLAKYASFCVVGQDSSVPYIRARLDQLGKPYVQARSYAPAALAHIGQDYDCILICGPQGRYLLKKPAIGIMRPSNAWLVANVDDAELSSLEFTHRRSAGPPSGEDWFHVFTLDRRRTILAFNQVRIGAVQRAKERQLELRAEEIRQRREKREQVKVPKATSEAPEPALRQLTPRQLARREERLAALVAERAALPRGGNAPSRRNPQ